jgi:uncharacterized membrane protein
VSRAHRIGIIFSAIGVGISAFILGEKIGIFPEVCGPAWGPFGGCKTVEASQWSSIGPIPIAAIGIVGSLVLLVAALVHARTKREEALMIDIERKERALQQASSRARVIQSGP